MPTANPDPKIDLDKHDFKDNEAFAICSMMMIK